MTNFNIFVFSVLLVLQTFFVVALILFYRRRHHAPIKYLRPMLPFTSGFSSIVYTTLCCAFRIFQYELPDGPVRVALAIFLGLAVDAFLMLVLSVFLTFRRSEEILMHSESNPSLSEEESRRLMWLQFLLSNTVAVILLFVKSLCVTVFTLSVLWKHPELLNNRIIYDHPSAHEISSISGYNFLFTSIFVILISIRIRNFSDSLGLKKMFKKVGKATLSGAILYFAAELLKGSDLTSFDAPRLVYVLLVRSLPTLNLYQPLIKF